jgi:hypothetical protein
VTVSAAKTKASKANAAKAREAAKANKAKQEEAIAQIPTLLTAMNELVGVVQEIGVRQDGFEQSMAEGAEKRNAPPTLPRAVKSEDRLAEVRAIGKQAQLNGDTVTARRTTDLTNPDAHRTGFQEGDYVMLKEDTEKYNAINAGPMAPQMPSITTDGKLYGFIEAFLGTRRNGLRKYKVFIDGIGRDGYLESDLELVQNAA